MMANAISITLAPSTQDIGVGGSFALSVSVTGLGNHTAPSLGAFDLEVNFDSTLAQFSSISFGDPSLGDLLAPVTPSINGSLLNITGDSLNVYSVSLDGSADLAGVQPNQFTLATLHFTALALGHGGFSLANVLLGDADGGALSLDGTQGANINIVPQAVPDGGAGWVGILSLGILTLGHRHLRARQIVS